MTFRQAVCLALAAGALSGCGGFESIWPGSRREVPVTTPVEVAEDMQLEPANPVVVPLPPEPEPNENDRETSAAAASDPNDAQPPSDSLLPEFGSAPLTPTTGSPEPTPTPPADPDGEVIAATLLPVRGEYISVDDVVTGAARPLRRLAESNPPRRAFIRQAAGIVQDRLRREVNQLAVLGQARRDLNEQQLGIVHQQVDEFRREMIASAGGSRRTLDAKLAEEGTTLSAELAALERDLILRLYWRQKLDQAIVINRRALWNYYQKNLAQFTTPRKVQMQILAFEIEDLLGEDARNPTNAQRMLARGRALELARQATKALAEGEEFAKVARQLSTGAMASRGGVWPVMEAGNYKQQKVEQVAFGLGEGEVSDIIETEEGYYVVKALTVQPGRVTPFAEAQVEIEQTLRTERERELVETYLEGSAVETPRLQTQRFLELAVEEALKRFYQDSE
jgi:hypothetical protein